jgi:hypothetical protein
MEKKLTCILITPDNDRVIVGDVDSAAEWIKADIEMVKEGEEDSYTYGIEFVMLIQEEIDNAPDFNG